MANKEQLATVFKMWIDFDEMKVNPYTHLKEQIEQLNRHDTTRLVDMASKGMVNEVIALAGEMKGRREFMTQVELILSEQKSKKEAEEELE